MVVSKTTTRGLHQTFRAIFLSFQTWEGNDANVGRAAARGHELYRIVAPLIFVTLLTIYDASHSKMTNTCRLRGVKWAISSHNWLRDLHAPQNSSGTPPGQMELAVYRSMSANRAVRWRPQKARLLITYGNRGVRVRRSSRKRGS